MKVNTFVRDIYSGTVTLKEVNNDQSYLLVETFNFRKQVKPKNPEKKRQKEDVLENLYNFFEGRERVLMLLIEKHFQSKLRVQFFRQGL